MMSDAGGPIYTAKVLDVVEWSPAGWCSIIVRFEEIAVPLVLDDLCYNPHEQYQIGADVAFTLSGIAYGCHPSQEHATIKYGWTLDLTSFTEDDFPVVPGSSYELHGVVLDCTTERLRLDCGLVVELVPRHGFKFPPHQPGDRVCVTGKLHLKVTERPDMNSGRPSLLRRRP